MGKNLPAVSFIITFYEQRQFAIKAIQSALDQSFADIEVIAVDDGSTDGGAELIRQIKDSRLKLITQENCGPSMAANAGIKAAQGEYIALLGGDDIARPDRILLQHELVSKGYTDISFHVPQIISEDDFPLSDSVYPVFSNLAADQFDRVSLDNLFFNGNCLCAPTAFMARSTFWALGPFIPGLIQLQDFEYWIRCLKSGYRISVSRDKLTCYRRRIDGLNLSNERFLPRVLVEEQYIMRKFFDGADASMIRGDFSSYVPLNLGDTTEDTNLIIALIYLYHHRTEISAIGFERLIDYLKEDSSAIDKAASVGLTMPVFFNEMLKNGLADSLFDRISRRLSFGRTPCL